MARQVRTGFALEGITLPVCKILPLRQTKSGFKSSRKFQQILTSIREVGLVEPLVVFQQPGNSDAYILTDGHMRLEALKVLGLNEAPCLVGTDDEAYTFNKRINKLSPIQEHTMILKAIRSGIDEERIARTLNLDIRSIVQRRDLLGGICKEASDMLRNCQVAPKAFPVLKRMKPVRQIEAAELMIAASNFSVPYAKALLVATPAAMLVEPDKADKAKAADGLTPEQISKMERELEVLHRDLKAIEDTHGNAVLNLVLARGYLSKLFASQRVTRFLSNNHAEIYDELRRVIEATALEG